MANSASTAVYAHGDIKWYAIYKSFMNALPVLLAYVSFVLGGQPYWLYIPMILIWGIGGDVVIVRYAKVMCGLSISRFLSGVLTPVLFVTLVMYACGYIVVWLFDESFLRLVLTCTLTTVGMIISLLLFGITSEERNSAKEMVKSQTKRDGNYVY